MSKDMMPAFELLQPDTLDNAIELLRDAGAGGWALAGGNDSLDWFKDRIKRPQTVVDLSGLDELRGIRDLNGGVEIGALTTLTEVSSNALIRERFRVLADAAGRVASPPQCGCHRPYADSMWYPGVECDRAVSSSVISAGMPSNSGVDR